MFMQIDSTQTWFTASQRNPMGVTAADQTNLTDVNVNCVSGNETMEKYWMTFGATSCLVPGRLQNLRHFRVTHKKNWYVAVWCNAIQSNNFLRSQSKFWLGFQSRRQLQRNKMAKDAWRPQHPQIAMQQKCHKNFYLFEKNVKKITQNNFRALTALLRRKIKIKNECSTSSIDTKDIPRINLCTICTCVFSSYFGIF